ncbi:hypothetical protein ACV35T_25820 [Pseudomonas aeruginosa]
MNAQTQFIEFHKFDADELASRIEQVMLTYQAATLPFAPMFYDDRVSRSQVHVGDVEAWDQEHGRNFKKEVLETREELVEGSSVYASLRDIMEVPNGKLSSLPHFYVEKKAYYLAELLDVHAKALEEGRDLIRPWIEKGGPTQQPVLNYALGSTKAEQAAAYEVFAELVEATYRAELVEKNKAETEARIQAAIAERRRIAAEEEAARLRREEEEARAAVLAEGDSILAQLAAEQAAQEARAAEEAAEQARAAERAQAAQAAAELAAELEGCAIGADKVEFLSSLFTRKLAEAQLDEDEIDTCLKVIRDALVGDCLTTPAWDSFSEVFNVDRLAAQAYSDVTNGPKQGAKQVQAFGQALDDGISSPVLVRFLEALAGKF